MGESKSEMKQKKQKKQKEPLLAWHWLDSKLGVTTGAGLPISGLALAVLLQWLLLLLQIFCRPCLRTIAGLLFQ